MLKQFGIVKVDRYEWRILTLHGQGDVLGRGVKVSDWPSEEIAIAKAEEFKESWLKCFPGDEVTITVEQEGKNDQPK